ncbi:MAG: acyl-CoA carboxylase subunit beta [Deltaproteobacteria bacterium]|nr:acyl-CoA carboxylase subunit beta [Deltaproteobacteria bacterium]
MTSSSLTDQVRADIESIHKGGPEKYHAKNSEQGKLFARERIALFIDNDSFVEDGVYANFLAKGLPADGVVTGVGRVNGREVAIMANDSTVKAGSWGARTVEKILRIQEQAMRYQIPMVYLVDSAGARITDQVEMFPGRRHAGRIFHNQVNMSGSVPQVCVLFGPSAAGGAYIPAFCDVVFMTKKNAAMYLGSPRMAEMVIGEKVSLEEMGGAKMHTTESGCADFLCKNEKEALAEARRYLGYFPQRHGEAPPIAGGRGPKKSRSIDKIIPKAESKLFDIVELIEAVVDEGSFMEVKKRFAKELVTGLARLDGRVIGVLANQPKQKGGVLFIDSADKAARFIMLCDAFEIPLLFLTDVPGFMIGSKVEQAGIIRHGAKMLSSMSSATVPRLCVVVRKSYGAGLYAMSGPAFEPDVTLALPQASIAVMGAEAAVNAVFFNKIQTKPEEERAAYVEELRAEYREDINVKKLASELVIDGIVPGDDLRAELIRRLAYMGAKKDLNRMPKKRAVMPV